MQDRKKISSVNGPWLSRSYQYLYNMLQKCLTYDYVVAQVDPASEDGLETLIELPPTLREDEFFCQRSNKQNSSDKQARSKELEK